jgi:hypothetical protein
VHRMVTTLIAQIVRFVRPNIRIYDARVGDLYQWDCTRYLVGAKGVETQKQRAVKLGSRPISERITLAFQTQSGPTENKHLYYISIGYGGEGVSQSLLKDKAFSTFLDQNPPIELRPEKGDFAFDKGLSRPKARHRQQCHQAVSERQIAVAPLNLIAVQSRNLMVAHPGSGPALEAISRKSIASARGSCSSLRRLGNDWKSRSIFLMATIAVAITSARWWNFRSVTRRATPTSFLPTSGINREPGLERAVSIHPAREQAIRPQGRLRHSIR